MPETHGEAGLLRAARRVEGRVGRRDQEGLPRPRARAASRRLRGTGRRGALPRRRRGLRGALRRRPPRPLRPLRARGRRGSGVPHRALHGHGVPRRPAGLALRRRLRRRDRTRAGGRRADGRRHRSLRGSGGRAPRPRSRARDHLRRVRRRWRGRGRGGQHLRRVRGRGPGAPGRALAARTARAHDAVPQLRRARADPGEAVSRLPRSRPPPDAAQVQRRHPCGHRRRPGRAPHGARACGRAGSAGRRSLRARPRAARRALRARRPRSRRPPRSAALGGGARQHPHGRDARRRSRRSWSSRGCSPAP